jgi:hypothetical protein
LTQGASATLRVQDCKVRFCGISLAEQTLENISVGKFRDWQKQDIFAKNCNSIFKLRTFWKKQSLQKFFPLEDAGNA